MNRILVLGYFGYTTNQLDGQTVKTRDVYRLTVEQLPDQTVDFYDTQEFQTNKISIFKMFWKVACCDTLFYLPAHNNLKWIFPIIYCLSALCRVKIHYFVVGGWLREFIANLPLHRYMLKRIAGIHTETQQLKRELEEYYQFKNVDIFPNFRFFDFQPKGGIEHEKLRLVFMARVTRQKGLDWIFVLAAYIQENYLQDKFSITFFGPIDEEDKDYFETRIAQYSCVEYKGALQPEDIHETLSQYDVMLLPTHYFTEGLPGSVVDAYISGIPVIVTEWKHAREFVDDGVSGYIIPFENGQQQLIEKVLLLEKDRSLLHQLQGNALIKRMTFAPPSLKEMCVGGGNCLKISYISRIEQSKGLDTLLEIAKILQENQLDRYVQIDFYGQKKDDYFDMYLANVGMYEYKGVLPPEEVIPTLKEYDALIFPSHYEGEGCPGILVEALSAALPIVASDWKYNSEFVANGVNGFLCNTFEPIAYVNAIKLLWDNKAIRQRMSKYAYARSENFSASYAGKLMKKYVE